MNQEVNQRTADEKTRSSWGSFALWAFSILIAYILSTGPVLLLGEKGYIQPDGKFFSAVYRPIGWACNHTPLGKPLGLYWHFWVPERFDKDGKLKLIF